MHAIVGLPEHSRRPLIEKNKGIFLFCASSGGAGVRV